MLRAGGKGMAANSQTTINMLSAMDESLRQRVLSQLYSTRQRPVCCCTHPPIEMYIAKVYDRYIVKRMPNTGNQHSPDCDSYEPPPELSGLGEVMGSAIKENAEKGLVELRCDFSMTKIAGRKPMLAIREDEHDSVKSDGKRLTLRSLLQFLWESAGFHKWSPAMEGKRSWGVVRKHLLASAEDKVLKGMPLTERLYIPEAFTIEKKQGIVQRRSAQLSKIASQSGPRQLMVLVGEVKEIVPARYGHKIGVKHVPDFAFLLDEEMHKALLKRFEAEIDLWRGLDDVRLMVIATFSTGGSASYATLEEVSLMMTTRSWIPIDNVNDKEIIDRLTVAGRRFMKGLRYNLPLSKPMASAVVTDTFPPTAMYVLPADADEGYLPTIQQLIEESNLASWLWDTNDFEPPELPPASQKGNK